MGVVKDIAGNKYGLLTVIESSHHRGEKILWKCKCICGNITFVTACDLKSGNTKSCGCLKTKMSTENYNYKNQPRLYYIYSGIKQRCYNKNSPHYKDYGERGIFMCESWKQSFSSFCEWALANGYKENLTIDRKDVNGAYAPENCQWISNRDQQSNRRNNIIISHNGISKTAFAWSEELKISPATIIRHYRNGETLETIIQKYKQ